jgi:hypothetical protein
LVVCASSVKDRPVASPANGSGIGRLDDKPWPTMHSSATRGGHDKF